MHNQKSKSSDPEALLTTFIPKLPVLATSLGDFGVLGWQQSLLRGRVEETRLGFPEKHFVAGLLRFGESKTILYYTILYYTVSYYIILHYVILSRCSWAGTGRRYFTGTAPDRSARAPRTARCMLPKRGNTKSMLSCSSDPSKPARPQKMPACWAPRKVKQDRFMKAYAIRKHLGRRCESGSKPPPPPPSTSPA